MDISLFDYELSEVLIAQKPCYPRDNSRLLNCVEETSEDLKFKDLPKILNPGDVLVINNTKVIPSRIFGYKDKVNIEVTLHLKVKSNLWRAFIKPGRKCKIGEIIIFKNNLKAKLIEKFVQGDVLLEFNKGDQSLLSEVYLQGEMPLPPYIKREIKSDNDKKSYQTIFADQDGAVAAPTAGLHFTPDLIKQLQNKGIVLAPITLHVGAGTFLPVKVNKIFDHKMHEEW